MHSKMSRLALAFMLVFCLLPMASADVLVQAPGSDFLAFEAESYDSIDGDDVTGWLEVDTTGTLVTPFGSQVLPAGSNVSGIALYDQPVPGNFTDLLNFKLQFATPGIYSFYMRYSMFEDQSPDAYGQEDSFYMPLEFGLAPEQAGWFSFPKQGHDNPAEQPPFWEGSFHWGGGLTYQEGGGPIEYEVTSGDVGSVLDFSISTRERGGALDAVVLSQTPGLLEEELDELLAQASGGGGGATRPGLIHRWSFSELSGTTVSDSIGGADGEVLGDDWEWTGGQLRLPGGISADAPYVDLPNGIISGLTDATVEGWLTIEGSQNWSRAFDFGSTDANSAGATEEGELEGPGGGANGQDYWMLSVQRGDNINQQRHELRNRDPLFGGDDEGFVSDTQEILDTDIESDIDEEYHFAAVYDSAGPELRTYRDGELEGTAEVTLELGNINDVNNWLGRSNWVNDAGFQGTFNEFRLYDIALDDAAVLASFEEGPDVSLGGGPAALQAGDADQDLDFDQLDLVQVQIAAKYLSGQPATWGEGDWDGAPGGSQGSPPAGNGFFDQLDIIAALTGGAYLTGPYAAIGDGGVENDGQTSIKYNPSTGEIAVDAPAGVELTSVNIDSAGGIFTGDAAANLGGSFDNDGDNNIFKATFGSSFGSISFGNVAQTGMSKEFMLNDLTVVGSLAGGGDLGAVDLIYVPEPSSLALLLLGAVAVLVVRSRRRQ